MTDAISLCSHIGIILNTIILLETQSFELQIFFKCERTVHSLVYIFVRWGESHLYQIIDCDQNGKGQAKAMAPLIKQLCVHLN